MFGSNDASNGVGGKVIKRLMSSIMGIHFCHIYHEGNSCVDSLANLTYDLERNFVIFEQPLTYLQVLLLVDCGDLCWTIVPITNLLY